MALYHLSNEQSKLEFVNKHRNHILANFDKYTKTFEGMNDEQANSL